MADPQEGYSVQQWLEAAPQGHLEASERLERIGVEDRTPVRPV